MTRFTSMWPFGSMEEFPSRSSFQWKFGSKKLCAQIVSSSFARVYKSMKGWRPSMAAGHTTVFPKESRPHQWNGLDFHRSQRSSCNLAGKVTALVLYSLNTSKVSKPNVKSLCHLFRAFSNRIKNPTIFTDREVSEL